MSGTPEGCKHVLIDSLSRRSFLIGTGSALVLVASGRALSLGGSAPVSSAVDPAFLRLSQVLTGKTDLEPVMAARIADALKTSDPSTYARVAELSQLATRVTEPGALLEAAGEAKLAALAIVAAWYTGTVGGGARAVTVAYRDALMQRPVADALYPATYALGGPAWWVASPPELNLPPT